MLRIVDLGKTIYLDGEPVGRPIKWDTMQVLAAEGNDGEDAVMLKVRRKGMKNSELIVMSPETAAKLGQHFLQATKLYDMKKALENVEDKEAKDA